MVAVWRSHRWRETLALFTVGLAYSNPQCRRRLAARWWDGAEPDLRKHQPGLASPSRHNLSYESVEPTSRGLSAQNPTYASTSLASRGASLQKLMMAAGTARSGLARSGGCSRASIYFNQVAQACHYGCSLQHFGR